MVKMQLVVSLAAMHVMKVDGPIDEDMLEKRRAGKRGHRISGNMCGRLGELQ